MWQSEFCTRIRYKYVTYINAQIEQFIESIFPSQRPGQAAPAPAGLTTAEAEKREAEEKEAKSDMVYLTLAVMAFLTLLTLLMVMCIDSRFFRILLTCHRSELHISLERDGHHSLMLPRTTLANPRQRQSPVPSQPVRMASSSQHFRLYFYSYITYFVGERVRSRVVLAFCLYSS